MKMRPWKISEVPVGEVLQHATERIRTVIVAVGGSDPTYTAPNTPRPDFVVKLGTGESLQPQQLLGWWVRLDGSPCGVPEND